MLILTALGYWLALSLMVIGGLGLLAGLRSRDTHVFLGGLGVYLAGLAVFVGVN